MSEPTIVLVLPHTYTPWPRSTPELQIMVSRTGVTGPWQIHTQSAGATGVRQHTRDVHSWAEVVHVLTDRGLHGLGLDAARVEQGLEEAISIARETHEKAAETGILDEAHWWTTERYVTRWIEENPAWTRDHAGDITSAVAAYLARFDDPDEERTIELIEPDPTHLFARRVQGAYRITETYGHTSPPGPGAAPPWTVEIDVSVDDAGEVFGRIREGTLRPVDRISS